MTASKPKVPTASGISRLLATAGFGKSISSASRIKGWRNHSTGFVVQRGDEPGQVRVFHQTSDFGVTDGTRARQVERQESYAQAIEAAGFAVERGTGGRYGALIVTAKTES